jgi:hypothetical protein
MVGIERAAADLHDLRERIAKRGVCALLARRWPGVDISTTTATFGKLFAALTALTFFSGADG